MHTRFVLHALQPDGLYRATVGGVQGTSVHIKFVLIAQQQAAAAAAAAAAGKQQQQAAGKQSAAGRSESDYDGARGM